MAEELKIPEQHAFETGNVIVPRRPDDGVVVSMVVGGVATEVTGAQHFSAAHNAAAILHGWGKKGEPWGHRHHANEPIKLSQADYLKALDAASATDEHGEYVPHAPAMSEHCELRHHHKAHGERAARHRAEAEKASKRHPKTEPTEAAKV